jgi:hypothetical protein
VRKAIERARAELSDECAAFMLVGDADGPLRMLAERRSAGHASATVGARGEPARSGGAH